MKIAIFRNKIYNKNNFYNTALDKNLAPFRHLVELNHDGDTISLDLLKNKQNKQKYTILCFLTPSIFRVFDYLKLFLLYPRNRKFLFLFEPFVVAPFSYSKIFHFFFARVYTRDDDLVDGVKYRKFSFQQSFHGNKKYTNFNNRKSVVLINGNKNSLFKDELYSERRKIIEFFENSAIDFDLYGRGRNRANTLQQKIIGFSHYASYRGEVADKIETLSQYKFCICFENMEGKNGYITEKIRDCFKAKCIPVYWGAENVSNYVPENCFIDYRKFDNNYNNLLNFLLCMKEDEYIAYMQNIEQFLQTELAQRRFDIGWANGFLQGLK